MEFSKLQVAEYPTWQSRKGEQWATISSPPPKWSTLNPAPNPVRIPPNRKDLNGSGNSFRWTEVFGPFRVHKYCPKIVLWQRPQSYLKFAMQEKIKNSPYPQKYIELIFDGKSNIYSVMWKQLHIHNWITAVFGNLATPNIHVEIGLLTDVSIGCYHFSIWTMVVSCFITFYTYIHWNECMWPSVDRIVCSHFLDHMHLFYPTCCLHQGNSGDFGTAPPHKTEVCTWRLSRCVCRGASHII